MTDNIKVIEIRTIEEAKEHLFFHQQEDKKIGRYRNLYVYRGMSDASYKLIPSIQRVCKDKRKELEEIILNNFAKYTEMENASTKDSIWHKMILGQHHGLPTRLLDWSRSPLMALHFAMTEDNMDMMDQRDCVLWRIDVEKLNKMLPETYQEETKRARQKVFSVEMLRSVCNSVDDYDRDMGVDSMVMLEPPTIDARIANQYSFFSIVPANVGSVEEILTKCEEGSVVKYIIDKNIRWEIRDMLDEANICERLVYPGLDGIAKWLNRHYFVRDLSKLRIKSMSLADLKADVIVNPTNPLLKEYNGVNSSIFHCAGQEKLTAACNQLAPAPEGAIVVTPAFDLTADKIYHVVGRPWDKDLPEESEAFLRKQYRDILEKAYRDKVHSIGFPVISSGTNSCPKEKALYIELEECRKFINGHHDYPMTITVCVLDAKKQKLGEEFLAVIDGKKDSISEVVSHITTSD